MKKAKHYVEIMPGSANEKEQSVWTFFVRNEKGSLWRCLLFFLTFFIGTSVFLIPLPALGLLRRYNNLRRVGRLAAGVMGVYYIYFGLITLQGSIH